MKADKYYKDFNAYKYKKRVMQRNLIVPAGLPIIWMFILPGSILILMGMQHQMVGII